MLFHKSSCCKYTKMNFATNSCKNSSKKHPTIPYWLTDCLFHPTLVPYTSLVVKQVSFTALCVSIDKRSKLGRLLFIKVTLHTNGGFSCGILLAWPCFNIHPTCALFYHKPNSEFLLQHKWHFEVYV